MQFIYIYDEVIAPSW